MDTNAASPHAPWEKVFVRHVREDRRLDIYQIERCLKAPFPTSSSSRSQWESEGYPVSCRPSGRWLLALKLARQSWILLFSNAATAEELFKTAAKSRALEAVWADYDPAERGWFFRLQRAGKQAVDFSLPAKHAGQWKKARFKSADLDAGFLDGCASGQEAVERLCRRFEVDPAAGELDLSEGQFRPVTAEGKPLLEDVRGYFEQSGYLLNEGEDPASDALAKAIERRDPEGVRRAAADGARLDALPDTSVSPLLTALFKCREPGGKECVEALVGLGCPANGNPGHTPTTLDCVAHFLPEDLSLEMLQTIVPLGADVNAVDPRGGGTALFDAVVNRRARVIHYLVAQGADPTIKDFQGISPIDWIEKRLNEESTSGEKREELAEILAFLTGNSPPPPAETPPEEPLPAGPLAPEQAALVRRAILEEKAVAAAPAALAPEHSATVREIIAQRAGVSAERLAPETNLVRDLGMDGPALGVALALIKISLDCDIVAILEEVQAEFQVDAEGRLPAAARQRVQRLLPGVDLRIGTPASLDDVFTVGAIEAVTARALAQRPNDLPVEGIAGRTQQEWVRQLPEELGPRKLRLLLAAACRCAFQGRRAEPEVADALDLLERFADTGESRKALRDFRRAFWEWRDSREPEYVALHEALTPNDPVAAVTAVAIAIEHARKLSATEAVRELRRLHADLAGPAAAGAFAADWRTPAVVELARSMCRSRDFREMPRLADLLEQAGCASPAVLEHCRGAGQVHVRGCWVVDAVLDGSWAEAPPAKPKGQSLLSRLPKRIQYDVLGLTEGRDGDQTLEVYLAKRWDFEGFSRSKGVTDERLARRIADCARLYPEWPPERIRLVMSFRSVCDDWGTSVAIARRIVREDPAELGRGESLAGRIRWLQMKLLDAASPGLGGAASPWEIVSALAVRDETLADLMARRAAASTGEETAGPDAQALLAVFRRDLDALGNLLAGQGQRKAPKDPRWIWTCFQGIAQSDPGLVTQGLQQALDAQRRARDKEGFGIVHLAAHGAYRLCRRVSPELVAGFDTTQAFPWDAEFHAWVEAHEDPLAGFDLSGVSPVLHEILVRLSPPDWWITARPGTQQDPCELVLTAVGPNPNAILRVVTMLSGISEAEARQRMSACPIVLGPPLPRFRAEMVRRGMESEGATVALRET